MDEIENLPSEDDAQSADIAKMRIDRLYDQYTVHLQKVLSDCQYIEEGLRFYISVAYKRIREKVGPDLPFKYGDDDIKKDALGKLIHKFERLSDDPDLVKRLKDLVPERNKYAHKGFLVDFGPRASEESLKPLIVELTGFHETTSALMAPLFKLLKKFVDGHVE